MKKILGSIRLVGNGKIAKLTTLSTSKTASFAEKKEKICRLGPGGVG